MHRMMLPHLLLAAALGLAGCTGSASHRTDAAAEVAATTLTAVGQPAPDFSVPTLAGDTFRLDDQRGKVVLVNFFATWCGPCREEMPHLQNEVWQRFAGDRFAMVSVAREETGDVVAPFVSEHGSGWTFALDEKRTAFARYADAYIPRNYVIDPAGTVVYQSQGYDADEFAALVATIARELAKIGVAPAP